eukprot:7378763-Prymnesium_polylepis.1
MALAILDTAGRIENASAIATAHRFGVVPTSEDNLTQIPHPLSGISARPMFTWTPPKPAGHPYTAKSERA